MFTSGWRAAESRNLARFGYHTGVYQLESGARTWNQGVFHVNLDDPEVAAQVKAGIIPKEPFYEDGQEVERPIGIYSDDLYTSKMLEYLEQGWKVYFS